MNILSNQNTFSSFLSTKLYSFAFLRTSNATFNWFVSYQADDNNVSTAFSITELSVTVLEFVISGSFGCTWSVTHL